MLKRVDNYEKWCTNNEKATDPDFVSEKHGEMSKKGENRLRKVK
jgi:hypothetical protein